MTMILNGSGTITGLSAGGLPDATIQQADLATNVAGNGPAFSAYSGTGTTLTAATWVKVGYDTEEFDTNNNFASSRFTPTVAGYYQISYGTGPVGATSVEISISLYKNGSQYKQAFDISAVNTWVFGGSHLVYLNGSTDYVEVYVFNAVGTKTSLSHTYDTWFQGFLARAA